MLPSGAHHERQSISNVKEDSNDEETVLSSRPAASGTCRAENSVIYAFFNGIKRNRPFKKVGFLHIQVFFSAPRLFQRP